MNKTPRCTQCGKPIPSDIPAWVGPFCDPVCGFNHNERATRRMGSLRRDIDGDWQEDQSHRYEVDRF